MRTCKRTDCRPSVCSLTNMPNSYVLFTILRLKHIHDLAGRFGDRGSRTVNTFAACVKEELIIVGRNNATGNDHDFACAFLFQLSDKFGNKRLMTGGQTGSADDMHVVLDGHFGGLFRGLEHRADIHVKTDIRVGRGHYLDAPVVAILTHLGDELPRTPAGPGEEVACLFSKNFFLNCFQISSDSGAEPNGQYLTVLMSYF